MSIDLRKMRQIVEVARSEGITLAAHNLSITQSALTRSVADVEAELGILLFQRLPRGVRVTDAGRDFIKSARRILGDFDELVGSIKDYRDFNTGKLRIGFSPGAFQKFFSEILVKYARDYPRISVEFFSGSAENQAPQLLSGELDLVLGAARQFSRWPELEVLTLRDLHCKILGRKDHPLLNCSNITIDELVKYPWIQASSIEPIDSDLLRILNKHGHTQIKPHYLCDDFSLVKDIIRNTDAVSPVFNTNPGFDHLKDQFMLLDNILEMPTHALAVTHSRSRALSPSASEFMRMVKNGLQK